ncbi:DUF6279 family lipoprotein [Aliiglaciecola litoralis]|uniref:Lipoprotein n=1 Tax=Aliiglaciecola litoralis TaxID=582857 RepID=A0ABP3X049_9ALTE
MQKRIIILLLSTLLFFVSGCSSKFAYNNIDWMLYWYVDDFIELDKQQKSFLDSKVDKWHAWHRSNELVEYRQHLVDIKALLQEGSMTSEQWTQHLLRGSEHWHRFRDQIMPELSVLAIQLTDQQIIALFEELEKNNKERIEQRNEDSLEERIQDNKEDTQKQIKSWTGKLTSQQVAIINDHVDQFRSTFEEWIVYRRNMQSATKSLMLARHQLDDFPQQLTELMAKPDKYRSSDYLLANEHNQAVFANMLAELTASLTTKQKKKVFKEIDDLIDDIDDLIED